MKIHKLPLTIGIIGIIIFITSLIRWGFVYTDYSNALFGMVIGGIILAFSYLYNWMKLQDNQNQKFKERINAIVDLWQKTEHESIVQKAKGVEAEL